MNYNVLLNRKRHATPTTKLVSIPLSARPATRADQRGRESQYLSASAEKFGDDYYRSTPCVTRVRGRSRPREGLL